MSSRLCPVDYILVHLGPEKPWVGVFLHEAVDFTLDFIEAGWGGIRQALLSLLPGTVVNVNLPGQREERIIMKKRVIYFH